MGENIKDFEIKIVTSADLAAAKASAQELGNISTAAKSSAHDQVKAGEDVKTVEEQAIGKKAELKKALHELGREFPIVGAAARVMFNPLALAAAAVTFIFQKLREDIRRLNESLTSSAWQGYGSVLVAQKKALDDAAQGTRQFAEQMQRLGIATQTASTASERLKSVFKASMGAQDRVDAARKDLEVSRVEAGEANPIKRQEKLLEIEERYAARKRAREEETTKFELQEQRRTMEAEGAAVQAIGKQLERARQTQAGLMSEAAIVEKLRVEKARLATITEEQAQKSERYDELGSKTLLTMPQQQERVSLWGQLESLGAQLTQQKSLVQRLEASSPGEINRWRTSDEGIKFLEGMQKGAAERGLGIAANLPTQERVAGIESATRSRVGGIEGVTRVARALGQGKEEEARLTEAMLGAARSGAPVRAEVLKAFQEQENFNLKLSAEMAEQSKRIRLMEGRPPRI